MGSSAGRMHRGRMCFAASRTAMPGAHDADRQPSGGQRGRTARRFLTGAAHCIGAGEEASRAGSLFWQGSGENRGGRHLQLALQYDLLHRGGHGQCALIQGHGGCRRFVMRARLPSLGPRDLLGELCGLAQRPGLLPRRSSRRGGLGRGVL